MCGNLLPTNDPKDIANAKPKTRSCIAKRGVGWRTSYSLAGQCPHVAISMFEDTMVELKSHAVFEIHLRQGYDSSCPGLYCVYQSRRIYILMFIATTEYLFVISNRCNIF